MSCPLCGYPKDETEMANHILAHDEAGHHVRRSILKWAKERISPP